jgi:hypothetical protein
MNAPARIGRYEIVRRLGKSMTDVYLAMDAVDRRKVALKVVAVSRDAGTQLVIEAERRGAAIQKEMQALDPRVVKIYECGEQDGYFFVAMEFVEGRNLAEVLQAEHVIEPIRAAAITLEICEQLAKFHSFQTAVVHSDVKPSNIHLGPNDTVRLLDFGIAKTLRGDGDATSHHFGSPGYCSPERLTRSEVDPQSDLWALGATLYEMLCGAPPYQAQDTRRLESLIRSKRPPRALPPNCPRGLRAIITKALAPTPAQRYGSARAFLADLQAFLEHKPPVAELERRVGWSANATLEAARQYLKKATRTVGRVKQRLTLPTAVGWFAAGMALWIGGSYAWQTVQLRSVAATTPPAAPPSIPAESLPLLYVGAADRILESYAATADPSLHHIDWQKAEICLTRAVELGAADDRTLGKLALSRGYAAFERLEGGHYAEPAASQVRSHVQNQFADAAQKLPREPAPHLALARVYVYALPDADKAMAEFAAAERLGAVLGRREIEQQADAYRIRGRQKQLAAPKESMEDLARARALYERIRGFDEADRHLAELSVRPVRAKRVVRRYASRRARWR